jgi:outer membrane protein assembly factor BamE
MKRLALSTLLLSTGALLSAGCVYKMNIQQGNYLVADSVSQLKEGMTRSQVRFLLGTPMVPVAFDDSRWDYYYFFSSKRQKEPLKRRLTVYFEDEKVARYENQGVPTQADLAQIEADLRKAIAETRKNRKRSLWQRMTGRGGDINEPVSETASEGEPKPDPLPDSAPLPEPAGTPSGPT